MTSKSGSTQHSLTVPIVYLPGALAGKHADAERHLAILLKARRKQIVPVCSAIEINNGAMFDGLRADARFVEVQRQMKLHP